MDLCDNQVFLDLRAKAVALVNENRIGNCCTVDCIIGVIKDFYDNLAADIKEEITNIMTKLNELEKISDQELYDFFQDCEQSFKCHEI